METICLDIEIEKPIWEVYEIMSTLGGLRSWLTRDARGNPDKGGALELGFGPERSTSVKVADARKNKCMAWTITSSTFPASENGINTKIKFMLEESGMERTQVSVKHAGWEEIDEFYRVCGYQWESALHSLKKVCETGRGEPLTPSMLTSRKATGWFPTA
jgi:hypothetical protein